MRSLLIIIFFLSNFSLISQSGDEITEFRDSLQNLSKKAKDPEKRFEELFDTADSYETEDPKKAIEIGKYMVDFADHHNLKEKYGRAQYALAFAFQADQKFQEAIKHFFAAIKLDEENKVEDQLISDYYALGNLYAIYLRDFEKAEKYYLKVIDLAQAADNTDRLASAYLNLGAVYDRRGEKKKFLEFTEKAMVIFEELQDYESVFQSSINMGAYYYSRFVETKNEKDFNNALRHFQRAYEIGSSDDHLSTQMPGVYIALGALELSANNFEVSERHLLKAEEMLVGVNNIEDHNRLKDVYSFLSELYTKQNNFEKSSDYLSKLMQIKDTIFYNVREDIAAEVEAKYQNEQQEKQLKIQNLQLSEKDLKLKQSETLRYALIIGLSLLAILFFIVYKRFREKKRTNLLLNKQKSEIEHKNKEITDSIRYAQRIQSAILPSEETARKYLEEYFIIYKPKDIVSGDFYWIEREGDTVFFGVADCTGHGVPGAIVSMLCHNTLLRVVKEYKISEPAKILDLATELIEESVNKTSSSIKDGMDISLCAYNVVTGRLEWAGANNPLWIVSQEGEFREIKPNKQPVGVFEYKQPFENHEVALADGEMLYLFSDGFADQFGGIKGKKYKRSNFSKLLIKNAHFPAKKQQSVINNTFEAWKVGFEQVDDVCVMGVRFSEGRRSSK
ncbi:MAG: SpoIIE family protein phosphatase [Brumimicrobium sp.]|nr:SpoIIE family protein phosphatase [Brumimicrobium sp.]